MTKKTWKYLSNIANITLYGFAFITVLVIILSLIGIKPYITVSGSMEPNIKTGSVCFVNHNVEYEAINVDDVIAFKAGGTLVTHRVIDITEEGMTTKGDNNEDKDFSTTKKSNFVGKTLFSIPYVGYVVMFFRQSTGLYIAGAILVLLVVLSIKDIFVPKEKEKINQ
jgi:signal peptidase